MYLIRKIAWYTLFKVVMLELFLRGITYLRHNHIFWTKTHILSFRCLFKPYPLIYNKVLQNSWFCFCLFFKVSASADTRANLNWLNVLSNLNGLQITASKLCVRQIFIVWWIDFPKDIWFDNFSRELISRVGYWNRELIRGDWKYEDLKLRDVRVVT